MDSTVKWHQNLSLQDESSYVKKELIKKDEIVVGVLTGRQKYPSIAIQYHLLESNKYARPPRELIN